MPAKLLQRRAVVRSVAFGCVLGLFALTVLASLGTTGAQEFAPQVRTLTRLDDAWGQVVARFGDEADAAREFVRAGGAEDRQPLASAIGSAAPYVSWLTRHGDTANRQAAARVEEAYVSYTGTLRALLIGPAVPPSQAVQVELAGAALREHAAAGLDRQRRRLSGYLEDFEQRERRLRIGSAVLGVADLALLGVGAAMLLSGQRRLQRLAVINRRQALNDPLTGLANRTLFADRTERAVVGANRRGQQVGLLLVDLDGFERINTELGHHRGDLLLIELAERIGDTIRESDTVARIGGDEFGVLLPDISSVAKASTVAQRIRKAIGTPVEIEGHLLGLRASVGISVYPAHGSDPVELLRHAEAAMVVAKRERLGVVVHVPEEAAALNPAGGPA